MGTALSDTPPGVNVRLRKFRGTFYAVARCGKGWVVIDLAKDRNKALKSIEDYHTNKAARWSLDVKMKDFFACVGCGERDRSLLETHHIEPVHISPGLRYVVKNGEYDCLWRHALMHKNEPVIMNMILLRLVKLLTERLYNTLSKCQKALIETP